MTRRNPFLMAMGRSPLLRGCLALVLGVSACDMVDPEFTEVVFLDSFDRENAGFPAEIYTRFRFWDVVDGSVDLVGARNPELGRYFPYNGNFVDLDGGTFHAGVLQTKDSLVLSPGEYNLQFSLAGNQRQADGADTVRVSLGDLYRETIVVPSLQRFVRYDRRVVITEQVAAQIRFEHFGGDNVGMFLDDVMLWRVPHWMKEE